MIEVKVNPGICGMNTKIKIASEDDANGAYRN